MAFCSVCGTQVPDGSTTCSAHSSAASGGSAQGASSGVADNIAGLLCYSPLAVLADIIFLLVEPYNRNKFIRFHAFQSLFLVGSMIVLGIGLGILVTVLAVVPVIGWILDILLWLGFVGGSFILFIMMMIKAYQVKTVRLPFIGDLAAKQAGL
jgi:uncharacterized membrane protein